MKAYVMRFAVALFAPLVFSAPSQAADEKNAIHLALLDMSSLIGPGPMGYGMMGPGMMGPGVTGPGMMAPGMMAPGMMAPGTMGMMGMGMMSIRSDQSSIKAGTVSFDVGEVADLQPNASGAVDVALTPGSYLLICNIAGHYAAGMVSQLQVVP